jgi:hypothetical protein
MTDPIATLSTLAKGAKALRWLASVNDSSFAAEREEMFREWIAELHVRLGEQIEHVRGLVEMRPELEAIAEGQAEDQQLRRLLFATGDEASREAMRDRRIMLACASAGLIDPTMTIAEKARAIRALRELDPSDIRALYALWVPEILRL